MSNYVTNEDGTYVDLPYTRFPAQCDGWADSQDITASMVGPANKYRKAIEDGDYNIAQAILNSNPLLKNMLINADTINRMKHGIMALERMFADTIQDYIKKFNDDSKASAESAQRDATTATEAANKATQKYEDGLQLVENLRTLKGNLPTDFTDYTKDLADARNYIDEKTAIMEGATDSLDGKSGMVPSPVAGSEDSFLRGDGTWQKFEDNLTSTATNLGLSANQGRVLKELIDDKASSAHVHFYAGSNYPGGTANSVNGFTFRAQSTDPGAGSPLTSGNVLIIYE